MMGTEQQDHNGPHAAGGMQIRIPPQQQPFNSQMHSNISTQLLYKERFLKMYCNNSLTTDQRKEWWGLLHFFDLPTSPQRAHFPQRWLPGTQWMYSCTGAGRCARNVASCQCSAINGNMYNQNSKTPVNSINTTNSTHYRVWYVWGVNQHVQYGMLWKLTQVC